MFFKCETYIQYVKHTSSDMDPYFIAYWIHINDADPCSKKSAIIMPDRSGSFFFTRLIKDPDPHKTDTDPNHYVKDTVFRGELGSYPPEEIVARAVQSFEEGVCEIWLTSEDTGAYGRSEEKYNFLDTWPFRHRYNPTS